MYVNSLTVLNHRKSWSTKVFRTYSSANQLVGGGKKIGMLSLDEPKMRYFGSDVAASHSCNNKAIFTHALQP